jgi:hypothetical protein
MAWEIQPILQDRASAPMEGAIQHHEISFSLSMEISKEIKSGQQAPNQYLEPFTASMLTHYFYPVFRFSFNIYNVNYIDDQRTMIP